MGKSYRVSTVEILPLKCAIIHFHKKTASFTLWPSRDYLSPTTGPRVVSTVLAETLTTRWRRRRRVQYMFWSFSSAKYVDSSQEVDSSQAPFLRNLGANLDWLVHSSRKVRPGCNVHYLQGIIFAFWIGQCTVGGQ